MHFVDAGDNIVSRYRNIIRRSSKEQPRKILTRNDGRKRESDQRNMEMEIGHELIIPQRLLSNWIFSLSHYFSSLLGYSFAVIELCLYIFLFIIIRNIILLIFYY